MIDKEEYTPIKLREHCIKTMQFSNKDSNAYKEHELTLSIIDENISLKYKLDKLETREQKLIDKLEEDINVDKERWYNEAQLYGEIFRAIKRVFKRRLANRKEYAQEILSIMKGEK